MKLHLHRYGGRVMCGKRIESVEHTDDEFRFQDSQEACASCHRARAADDEREMQEQRHLSGDLQDAR